MEQNRFEMLVKKAQDKQISPEEKLELIKELNDRLKTYNKLLEQAFVEIPE